MSHSKQSLLLGLDEKLAEFSPSQSILPVTITDVQPVASYSLHAHDCRSIVPKRVEAQGVKQDSGAVFVDQNAHRMSGYGSPFCPCSPPSTTAESYDYSRLDFVTDRSNLCDGRLGPWTKTFASTSRPASSRAARRRIPSASWGSGDLGTNMKRQGGGERRSYWAP
ncbi:hypothetical protein BDZ89DRAFT_1133824 [Hymenopellis radicata]|nr:hypothetical protein BDZ89DRAFT_1133824 [Hymenopellis radicata]